MRQASASACVTACVWWLLYSDADSMQVAGKRNPADARWLQQVRRSGTTNDRVAALTLTLQVCLSCLRVTCMSVQHVFAPAQPQDRAQSLSGSQHKCGHQLTM